MTHRGVTAVPGFVALSGEERKSSFSDIIDINGCTDRCRGGRCNIRCLPFCENVPEMPKTVGCRHTLQRNPWLHMTLNNKVLWFLLSSEAGKCSFFTKLLLEKVFQVSSKGFMQSKRYFRLIWCDNMAVGAERCRYELLPWDAPVFHISARNSDPLYVCLWL